MRCFAVLVFVGMSCSAFAENWPQFRGVNACGIAEGAAPPVAWDVASGEHVAWSVEVPGLAHSSPVVWGDRIYLTTAVREGADPELRVGLYGDVEPVEDDKSHRFVVLALDRANGSILWTETAHTGVPKVKRHPKSTHANSSPATDGAHVVAFFGSEGLYCYGTDGDLLWSKDFGVLDSGFFMMKNAQWGFASSPIIHDGKVIVQCDVNGDSFLAALDVKTGDEVWRTAREEVPTWSTPTIYEDEGKTRIAVNGWKHIGGYDLATGAEVWSLVGGGDIPVPTPVLADDLIFIHNAHGRLSPIYAIRTSATGDISLEDGASSNEGIQWSYDRGGAYMATGIVYEGLFYNLQNNGRLTVYDAKSGEEVYEERLGETGTGFSASPVAANGHVYFASEDGDVFVVKAGRGFGLAATNSVGGICMATPAIAGNVLYVRTDKRLIALGE